MFIKCDNEKKALEDEIFLLKQEISTLENCYDFI